MEEGSMILSTYLVQVLQIKIKAPFVGLPPLSMQSYEQFENQKNKE